MANSGGSYTADKDGTNKKLIHRTAARGEITAPVAPPERTTTARATPTATNKKALTNAIS